MRSHHIPGNVRCIRCNGPTRNVTPFFCLPCLIEMDGQKVPDFALDARFQVNSRFSGPRLLAFAEKHHGIFGVTNKSILDLNPIIIKACEQAREDLKTIVDTRDCPLVSRIIRRAVTSAKSGQPRLHERLRKLLTQLIAKQDGLCPYCASPLTPKTTHLDTVLPTGFDHSCICLTTKLVYYQANALAGNLMAVCGTCNYLKGWAETRGVRHLRLIASGHHPAQPVRRTDLFTARKPRFYFNLQDLSFKRNGAYALAEWEILKQAIECFALRITYACHHKTDWLFVRLIEEARTLIFGCSQCVPPASAILAVDVRSKNWMRTEKHYDSPRRRTERQWIWVSWRELQPHLHRRPEHEIAFETGKKLHERFGFPPPPPLEVLAEQCKARAVEANVEMEVNYDMRRLDGYAEVARRMEADEKKWRQEWRSKYGGKPFDSWARN
jgi:hypothetical protein